MYRTALSEGADREATLALVRGALQGLNEAEPASWSEDRREAVRGAIQSGLSLSANSAIAASELEATAIRLLQADLAHEAHRVRCSAQKRESPAVKFSKRGMAVSASIAALPAC